MRRWQKKRVNEVKGYQKGIQGIQKDQKGIQNGFQKGEKTHRQEVIDVKK